MSFDDLGLGPKTLRAVAEAGYTRPTAIQEKAIPYILDGEDVLGSAQTGTGKTASFTLPMIEHLHHGRARARMPRSLILTPTRELAAQVAENFETYGKYHSLTKALLVGGVSMGDQIKRLERGVDVLIATPGRLLDLFDRGKILLSDIRIFVIDECDRMLDMGFIPDIERIVKRIPAQRQTLMFSATFPAEVRRIAMELLDEPREIRVSPPTATADTVAQGAVATTPREKRDTLRALIAHEDVQNALIFCNRKKEVAALHRGLAKAGYSVGALHGDMTQPERTRTLDSFRNDEIAMLVCSDVAARGLDIQGLSHVFNYDVPFHSEDYIHRIGRTGRAGKSGRAFTLVTDEDLKALGAIEKLIGNKITRVTPETAPDLPDVEVSPSDFEPVIEEGAILGKARTGRKRRRADADADADADTGGSKAAASVQPGAQDIFIGPIGGPGTPPAPAAPESPREGAPKAEESPVAESPAPESPVAENLAPESPVAPQSDLAGDYIGPLSPPASQAATLESGPPQPAAKRAASPLEDMIDPEIGPIAPPPETTARVAGGQESRKPDQDKKGQDKKGQGAPDRGESGSDSAGSGDDAAAKAPPKAETAADAESGAGEGGKRRRGRRGGRHRKKAEPQKETAQKETARETPRESSQKAASETPPPEPAAERGAESSPASDVEPAAAETCKRGRGRGRGRSDRKDSGDRKNSGDRKGAAERGGGRGRKGRKQPPANDSADKGGAFGGWPPAFLSRPARSGTEDE